MTGLLAVPAAAQSSGPSGDNPAVEQYVEQIPSSGESTKGGKKDARKKRGKALPKRVRERLDDADPVDRQLNALASDPALGAPSADAPAASNRKSPDSRKRGETGGQPAAKSDGDAPEGIGDAARSVSSPPSVADAGTTSGSWLGGPPLLIAVLLGITVVAVLLRRRSRAG